MNPMQSPNTGVGRKLCPEGRDDRLSRHTLPWGTIAYWPDGSVSEDEHATQGAAWGVRALLMKEGNDKGFPTNVVVVENDLENA